MSRNSISIALRTVTAILLLAPSAQAWALTEGYIPTTGDYLFYAIAFSGLAYSAAFVAAHRDYRMLLYTGFFVLLVLQAASMDGTLAYIVGPTDFVIWVVPFLFSSGIACYGFLMIAGLIEENHPYARFRTTFRRLAIVAAIFPLSSYFWLKKIPLNWMWVPVNLLFFSMVLAQILPPRTWTISDPLQRKITRSFPIVVGVLVVGFFVSHFLLLPVSQSGINFFNRATLVLSAAFALPLVLWLASSSAREREAAERQVLVAARKEAEMKLALANADKEYEEALAVAQRSHSQLATVSHDLKQPIAALRAAAAQLQQTDEEDAAKLTRAVEYIDSLSQAYTDETLADQVGAEPDARGKTSEEHLEAVPTSLLINTLQQMFSEDAAQQGIELRLVETGYEVEVVPLACMRIMNNLLGNAIKHSGASRILVGFRLKSEGVEFQVRDNGAGMNEEEIAHSLTPWGKSDDSTGEGLGLGIVQDLCARQGMHFSLRSKRGQGTLASVGMSRR
jgi:signal transduction histidine kinase